jgi:SAM-dependent methyltransferase
MEPVDLPEDIAGAYEEELAHGVYERRGGRTDHTAVFQLLNRWRFNRPPKVLDLGCGDGAVAQALHDAGWDWENYTGIDFTPGLLERFERRRLPKVSLSRGDATDLSAIPEGVDAVLCFFMLQHLPEDRGVRLLQEMVRVLSPDGVILIGAPVVPGGQSVAYIGERGYGDKKTRRWNWGEIALCQYLERCGLSEVGRYAVPNKNGVVSELYLLMRRTGT